MNEAKKAGKLKLEEKELAWIELIENDIREIPDKESEFTAMMLPLLDGKFIPSEYGL